MRYTIEQGVKNIKSKVQKIIIGLAALAFPAALVMSSGAVSAAPAFGLQPFEFVGAAGVCGPDPGIDTVTAEWTNSTGAGAPSILLQKLGDTSNCAAAGVDILSSLEGGSVSALTELNFDYKTGEWCGGGAPRFNVQVGGNTYFLGCNGGVATTSTADPNWTHVEFGSAQFAAAGIPTTGTLEDIYMLFDEGTDLSGNGTPGAVHIDNISVNGEVVGSPTGPVSKDDCKKGNWVNLLDANGKSFKNQGDCVSYIATGGKNVANGL